jgi:hypothetical protein
MAPRLNVHLETNTKAPARTGAAPNVNPSLPGPVGVLPLDAVNSRKHDGDTNHDDNSDITLDDTGDDDGGEPGSEDLDEEINCLKCD